MPSQTRSPSIVVSDPYVGSSGSWQDPMNAVASDDVYAEVAFGSPSELLRATDFGFSIPAGATIDGIELIFEGFGVGLFGGGAVDNLIRVIKNGAYVGTNLANAAWAGADFVRTFGGPADLLGEAWTPADINSANFGWGIAAASLGFGTFAEVDHMQITVHYTEAPPPPPSEPVRVSQRSNHEAFIPGLVQAELVYDV